jgi:hypothetical protein
VFTIRRNQCSRSTGIYVHDQTESVFTIHRNPQTTPATPVTILSDGAEGPRSLGEAASVGPTHHVLDWFHLSMRIQHVAQAAGSWPDSSDGDRATGARLNPKFPLPQNINH